MPEVRSPLRNPSESPEDSNPVLLNKNPVMERSAGLGFRVAFLLLYYYYYCCYYYYCYYYNHYCCYYYYYCCYYDYCSATQNKTKDALRRHQYPSVPKVRMIVGTSRCD